MPGRRLGRQEWVRRTYNGRGLADTCNAMTTTTTTIEIDDQDKDYVGGGGQTHARGQCVTDCDDGQ